MTFEDAIRKSIKAYFNGLGPDALRAASPNRKMKYTKKYFDKVGEEFGVDPFDPKEKKKGKY